MVGITERNEQKKELVALGYSLKYIDDWQPKTTLYRHKEAFNTDGEVSGAIGSTIANLPGNPSYVLPKAKIGLFTWPPSETCECRWCIERRSSGAESRASASVPEDTAEKKEETPIKGNFPCDECDYLGKSPNGLRMHVINRHPN